MEKKIICIKCPKGCEIITTYDGNEITELFGNSCSLGPVYAEKELNNPERTITTTVKILNALVPLIPVWSENPVEKASVIDIVKFLKNKVVYAPVQKGQILFKNILNKNINIISSCSVEKIS